MFLQPQKNRYWTKGLQECEVIVPAKLKRQIGEVVAQINEGGVYVPLQERHVVVTALLAWLNNTGGSTASAVFDETAIHLRVAARGNMVIKLYIHNGLWKVLQKIRDEHRVSSSSGISSIASLIRGVLGGYFRAQNRADLSGRSVEDEWFGHITQQCDDFVSSSIKLTTSDQLASSSGSRSTSLRSGTAGLETPDFLAA